MGWMQSVEKVNSAAYKIRHWICMKSFIVYIKLSCFYNTLIYMHTYSHAAAGLVTSRGQCLAGPPQRYSSNINGRFTHIVQCVIHCTMHFSLAFISFVKGNQKKYRCTSCEITERFAFLYPPAQLASHVFAHFPATVTSRCRTYALDTIH